MNRHIENALAQCDRALHGIACVAIRYDMPSGAASPDDIERFFVRNGESLDEAGRQAAAAFATHLRARARETNEWADRIERALARETEGA